MTRYKLTFTDTTSGRSTTVTVRAEQGDTPARLASWAIQVACASLGVTGPGRLRLSAATYAQRDWFDIIPPRDPWPHIAPGHICYAPATLRDLDVVMSGFMATLTPDQRAEALAYRGDDTHGDYNAPGAYDFERMRWRDR